MQVETRDWTKKITKHTIIWAILIDAVDFVTAPLFAWIPVLGELAGLGVDGIQAVLAFLCYKEPLMWGAASIIEAILPSTGGIDLFPTYSLAYIYISEYIPEK